MRVRKNALQCFISFSIVQFNGMPIVIMLGKNSVDGVPDDLCVHDNFSFKSRA